MKNVRIATTLLHSLRPVGSGTERDHGLLTDLLRRQIGPEAANFLAEPVPALDASKVDWYVTAKGRPIPLGSLAPDAQSALLAKVENLRSSISALADRLGTGSHADRDLATALRHALQSPADGAIYEVDGNPVLVGWGYVDAERPNYESGLRAGGAPTAPSPSFAPPVMGRAPETPAAPAIPAVSSGIVLGLPALPLLLWLLFAILAVAVAWTVYASCLLPRLGVFPPLGSWAACAPPGPAGSTGAVRVAELRAEIADLEGEIVQADALCAVDLAASELEPPSLDGLPLPADAPPLAEAVREVVDERIERSGAQGGELQISLIWDGAADLDLSITCPDGQRVDFRQREGCGAVLDTDANGSGATELSPVENIFWSDASAIPAEIPVDVVYFSSGGDMREEIPYSLRIRRTTLEPSTGLASVEDELIEGVSRRSEALEPQHVTTIGTR